MNRTIQTIAATSLLLLATGCAVPQSAGNLQGSAANAITGVADRMSGRNSGASNAGASAAHGTAAGNGKGGTGPAWRLLHRAAEPQPRRHWCVLYNQ